jgi:hypothetical protein
MKYTLAIISIAILFSCNSNDPKTTISTKESKSQSPSSVDCYKYTRSKDSIELKIIRANGYITGTLEYNLDGKDRNTGTIQGEMKGDMLVADYTFESEGMKSIRQVIFKKDGDGFIEGYGDVLTQDNKVRFKNIDAVQFSNSIKLAKVDCQE